MTQTTFTDNVLIEGSQDIEQLRVQGHSSQAEPLQTWENSAGDIQAMVSADGRLEVGDYGLAAADALLEVHRADTSTSRPKRGLHSLGQVSGTLTDLVQWIVGELEVRGSSAIDALHTALRIRVANKNSGTPTINAELRGADIEVINSEDASSDTLPRAVGLQISVTNADENEITEAVGLMVKLNNEGIITNPYAIFTEGEGVVHFEDYVEVMVPAEVPGTPDSDFIRIYPKSDGKLYAKNWSGNETELGGSGGSESTDDPSVNQIRLSISASDPCPAPGSTGTTLYIHPFNGERISLYDPNTEAFVPRVVESPIALDMTAAGALGGNQVPFMPQDVFLYWDPTTDSIQAAVIPWAAAPIQKSVTNITNASPPVLTVGASHGFVTDDLVVLQDVTGGAVSLTNKLYRVIATTSTTVSLGNLDATNVSVPGGSSTNGTLYKISNQTTRSSALTTLRGVKTYFDSATDNYFKLIATVAYGETKDTIYDTLNRPFIVNIYNKKMRQVAQVEPNGTALSWNVQTTAHTPSNSRPAGGRYQERLWFLTALDGEDEFEVEYTSFPFPPNVASLSTGYRNYLSLDAIANYSHNSGAFSRLAHGSYKVNASTTAASDTMVVPCIAPFRNSVSAGLHFLQAMEHVFNSGANNWSVWMTQDSSGFIWHGGFEGKYPR